MPNVTDGVGELSYDPLQIEKPCRETSACILDALKNINNLFHKCKPQFATYELIFCNLMHPNR